MIRGVLGSRASIGGVLGNGRGGAAAAWYLAGGVSAANCVAAYQPIGAASLAASYVNLANPGTYTAAPGTAPTFDTATGWTFNGAQYLTTGIVPAGAGYSLIVQFSDYTSPEGFYGIAGEYDGDAMIFIYPNRVSQVRYAYGNNYISVAPAATGGNLCVAGGNGYRNGTYEGSGGGTWGSTSTAIDIGRVNGTGSPAAFKLQAISIYNTTLTAPQVAAISSAMSAL